jgi:predicted DNA-binding WGR domain protein
MGLEEKVVVTLYELTENGHHIEHDSPVIGAYQTYGHWSKSHGIYQARDEAETARTRLIKQRVKEGYEKTSESGRLHRSYSTDLYVKVEALEVDKARIREDLRGQLRYCGRRIR